MNTWIREMKNNLTGKLTNFVVANLTNFSSMTEYILNLQKQYTTVLKNLSVIRILLSFYCSLINSCDSKVRMKMLW